MTKIAFTQYVMPNGRQQTVYIDRPDDIAAKAQQIADAGLCLECEMLSDGSTISLTVTDPEEGDLKFEIVPNGPEVPMAVDRLVAGFDIEARK